MKKSKISTPAWITEGYDSPAEYEKAKGGSSTKKKKPAVKKAKGKVFNVKECPKCKSDDVGLVLSNSDSEEGGGEEWECHKCGWKGKDIHVRELTEDEFLRYLDERGREVA